MRSNLWRLRYYLLSVALGGFMVWALPGMPWAIPWAAAGLPVGALLGLLGPARRRQRSKTDMTLTLTTVGGALIVQLARSVIHDQQVLMSLGVLLGGGLVGWNLVFASRLVLHERSA